MNSETAIELVASQTTINLQAPSSDQLGDLSYNDIFQTLKQINAGLEPSPSLLEVLLVPGKGGIAKAIEELKIAEVQIRRILIKKVEEQVEVYAKACKNLLKAKAEKVLTGNFDRILLDLAYINDKVIGGYLNVYQEFVRGIESMKDLPEEIRQTAIANAAERLRIRSEQSQQSMFRITENLREEIIKFNHEIGMC